MKKWAWLWFMLTAMDLLMITAITFSGRGVAPQYTPFMLSRIFQNIPYWYDSVWYIFNIYAVHGVFAWLGYLIFKRYKKKNPKFKNILLFIWLYFCYGFLIVVADYRFTVVYPSYLYKPFTIDALQMGLLILGGICIVFYILGLLLLHLRNVGKMILLYGFLSVLCYYPAIYGAFNKKTTGYQQKDVLFILLDAVRYDHLKAGGAPFDIMPKLNKFIEEQGAFYKDTTVSVGRSFPSAMAMLTGQNAISNGARDNVFPKSQVKYTETLAHYLRNQGYQTALSNDGYQFYSFDKDFGFDHIWSAGTSVLKMAPLEVGGWNPLTMLFVNTRIGELFFPYTYSDRNVDKIYQTSSYVNKIDRGLNFLDPDKPLFYLLDMNLTHLPYADETEYSRQVTANLNGEYFDSCKYFLASMNVIDDQLFQMLELLRKNGRLENTLLVIGSDHGQGFDMAKDLMHTKAGFFPHGEGYYGNNAYNKSSVNMALSLFSFGDDIRIKPGIRAKQVESIDIMPTILDLLNLKIPETVEGTSFAHNLLTGEDESNKYRFVESGTIVKPEAVEGLKLEVNELALSVVVDLNTLAQGWSEVRQNIIKLSKERAVVWGDWALVSQNLKARPLIVNRKDNIIWNIDEAPVDVPVKGLVDQWCKYNMREMDFLSKHGMTEEVLLDGLCNDDSKKENLWAQLESNPPYNREDFVAIKSQKKVSTLQFFCTRFDYYSHN